MVFTAIMTSFQCGNSITPPYLIVLKTVAVIKLSDFCNTNIAFDNDMTVDLFEMKAVIDDVASNKSPGLDGLSAEHFKCAHSRLLALMSMLVSSIVVHGHVPHSMNEYVIVPIIKDKNKRVNDKRNYRPICLSNI